MTEHTVTIRWGQAPEPDDEPSTYTFDTKELLDAFLTGVECASGWMEYEIVEDDDEEGEDVELTYEVTLTETVTYTVRVTSANREDAGQAARNTWAQSEDPFNEFDGQAVDMVVDEVRELDE